MAFRYARRNWLRQPSGLVYPDLGGQFVPEQVWLPQYTTKIWNRDRLTYPDGTDVATNTNDPTLMASPGGWAYANTADTANSYFKNLSATPNYNDCVGAVFLPFSTSAGLAFGLTGEGGNSASAMRLAVGVIGTGNIGANVRLSQATGTTVVVDSGVSPVIGRPVCVAFIVRDASSRTLYIDGVQYDDTQAGGLLTVSLDWAFTNIQAWKLGTAAVAGQLTGHTLMGWSNTDGRDPGHEWFKKWTSDPWSMFDPKRRRLPIASVSVYHPGSDISVSGWTPSTGSDLFDCIDESVASDADYIISPDLSTSATFGLTTPVPAGTWDVNFRARQVGSGAAIRIVMLDSGGSSVGASGWQTQSGSFSSYVASVTTTGTADRFRIEVQP